MLAISHDKLRAQFLHVPHTHAAVLEFLVTGKEPHDLLSVLVMRHFIQ